ncbi:RIP metalloprotease RseP [Alicyclobacillaceae bacterium I2511]|nr:RIP metalloprotease RseP [Alicyclobacillaceae bacterium I2511]
MVLLSLWVVLKWAIAIVTVFLGIIVIHEFGHFIVAKWSGVTVPVFAVGFGPKLVKWVKGGTEYSIRPYLFGGFVQLSGEVAQETFFRVGEQVAVKWDEDNRIAVIGEPSDLPEGEVYTLRDLDLSRRMEMTLDSAVGVHTYRVRPHARLMTNRKNSLPLVEPSEQMIAKPWWKRAAIILAGPGMNFLLAGVLFSLVFLHNGIPVNQPVLGSIIAGSPAAQAGLMPGDRVVAVDGRPVSTWVDLVQNIRGDFVTPLRPLSIQVVRNGQTRTVRVTPALVQGHTPELGVAATLTHNPVVSAASGFSTVYQASAQTLSVLYHQVLAHHQFKDLSGPVGIAYVIGEEAQTGFWNVLMIGGLLSLNLGLMNLLPIPALDGGRLFFMLVELVRGRALDPRKEGFVHIIGFALLMLFGVVITYRDVLRLF